MRIAIHHKNGTFSDRWIEYCQANNITFKLVDCYANNIINELDGCRALLWHWDPEISKGRLAALELTSALEHMPIAVFPNRKTAWHFDNKLAQKYLLESIGAPLVPTYVFFIKDQALRWIESTEFPKVFKLRCGAGSRNVRLVRTKDQARRLCKQAFARGFKAFSGYLTNRRIKLQKLREVSGFLRKVIKVSKFIYKVRNRNTQLPRERGYVYFQDFLPENQYDIRITVIGNRAFGFSRKNRKGDFRASGSGEIIYDKKLIESKYIQVAFDVAKKIDAQSLAFDFLKGKDGFPKITEISYCYVSWAVHDCAGFWSPDLAWHKGHVWPEDAILQDLLDSL